MLSRGIALLQQQLQSMVKLEHLYFKKLLNSNRIPPIESEKRTKINFTFLPQI